MQIDRVLETCLYVDNLERAEAFYRKILGLPVFGRFEDRHVFFRCGEGMFLLFNPQETVKEAHTDGQPLPHGTHGSTHVAFAVDQSDVGSWRDHLVANGVPIEREVEWPEGGYSIYFRDPAGNCLELATPAVWQLT